MSREHAVRPAASGRQAGIVVDRVHVRYGVIDALADVSLELSAGVVHGLVGHNGSGKSTLARLLAGTESPTAGSILWDGDPITLGGGISVVHQSLGLVDQMTALENYGVSSAYDTGRRAWISWRREAQSFDAHRSVLDVDVRPGQMVRDMSPAQRASLALMRCLRALDKEPRGSRFVILDEISSYLDAHERERLAAAVAQLAAAAVGVVFISHYLDEVLAMCSQVSVLRAGRMLGTFSCHGMAKTDLSELMFAGTAKEIDAARARTAVTDDALNGFSLRPFVDATVRPGEILGITGRSGGAYEALPYALTAQLRRDRTARKVSLVPSDRAARGVWLQGSIAENLTLSRIRQFGGPLPGGFSPRRERAFVQGWLAETNFRVSGPETKLEAMSGGMQQKVLVGRALLERPDLLVLHEPTQGIDVSARAAILEAVAEAAREGTAVVLVTREHDELVELCDSVIVCSDHARTIRLTGSELTEPALAAAL